MGPQCFRRAPLRFQFCSNYTCGRSFTTTTTRHLGQWVRFLAPPKPPLPNFCGKLDARRRCGSRRFSRRCVNALHIHEARLYKNQAERPLLHLRSGSSGPLSRFLSLWCSPARPAAENTCSRRLFRDLFRIFLEFKGDLLCTALHLSD